MRTERGNIDEVAIAAMDLELSIKPEEDIEHKGEESLYSDLKISYYGLPLVNCYDAGC